MRPRLGLCDGRISVGAAAEEPQTSDRHQEEDQRHTEAEDDRWRHQADIPSLVSGETILRLLSRWFYHSKEWRDKRREVIPAAPASPAPSR